jgi:hypothetical protein
MVLCLGIAAGVCADASITYSAVGDFSASSNPNGVWSYGYEDTLGGAFTLFAYYNGPNTVPNGTDLNAWATAAGFPAASATPYIGEDNNPTTDATFNLPPNLLLMHPGQPGGSPAPVYAVVRWTAPATGTVNVSGLFSTAFDPTTCSGAPGSLCGTSDVHILDNGVDRGLFNFTGSAPFTDPFSLVLSVSSGDTIDFVVGPGTDNDYNGDATGLGVTISSVPEPATVWCFGAGLLALGLVRRYRRRMATAAGAPVR